MISNIREFIFSNRVKENLFNELRIQRFNGKVRLVSCLGLVQAGTEQDKTIYLSKLPRQNRNEETCKHLTNPDQNDKPLIEDIYRAASVYYNFTGETKCNDISVEAQQLGTEGWNFQACTEMVLPICANGNTDMFEVNPWNFTAFSESCYKTYGVYADSEKALVMFGGKHITTATNIIFSNGLRDPWSAGGVLKTLAPSLEAIQIPNACHHEDLRAAGPNDPPELRAARVQEISIIMKWINDYYKEIDFYPKEWKQN